MVAYKQLIYPNLDDDPKHPLYIYDKGKICTNWVGWCLAVCKASFGATKSMGTALKAWNADPTKHTNYDLPEGVYCLIWWNGGHTSSGEECGHVAIAKRTGDKVKIWSSPYKKSATFKIFEGAIKSTIDGMTKTYGCNKYLGWSEMVCEKRVIEQIKGEKSNEEICKEVWEGKWGKGKDREKRLTEAGYDYATIQKMVDAGIGKPEEKKPEPQKPAEEPKEPETVIVPTPEPEPLPEPSPEPTEPSQPEPIEEEPKEIENNEPKEENMAQKEPVEPAQGPDIEQIGGFIEEASNGITIPTWLKVAGYILGDVLFLVAIEIPMIVNAIQAPNMSVWAEYASKAFMAGGIWVLLVVKLIKKKK